MLKILGPLPYLGTSMSTRNVCFYVEIRNKYLSGLSFYLELSFWFSLVIDLFSNVCFKQTPKTATNMFCSFQVNLRMTHKLVFYTETSSTNSATVRLFSCMYSHVSLYIYPTVKTPVTKITREFPNHPSLVLSPQAWIWNKEMAQC